MNAVWNSYGQLCGCPEIFKKVANFFVVGLTYGCLSIWKWKSSNPSTFFLAVLHIIPTVLGASNAPSGLRQTKDNSLYPSGTSSDLGRL